LTATASEISRAGRSGLYDVIVANQHNKLVAALRGRCHEIRGRHVL
jgi:acyl-CoA thioesterase